MAELNLSVAKTFVAVSGSGLSIPSLLRKSFGAVLESTVLRARQREVRLGELVQIVDDQIIPNLMRAHPQGVAVASGIAPEPLGVDPSDVDTFTGLAIAGRVEALIDFIAARVAAGAPRETVYSDLLAPAERRLDAWWREDRCRSADVTIGRCVLRQVLRELSLEERLPARRAPYAAYFTALPGEDEPFGLHLTEAAFGRSGWRTWTEPATSCGQITSAVRTNWFDLMGISLSSRQQLERAPEIVKSVHDASKNRAINVILCGSIFNNHPELSASTGADAAADEGMAAVAAAEAMLSRTANDP